MSNTPASTLPKPQDRTLGHAPGRGKIYAIASGKGGVGKTWFSSTLCQALTKQKQRVLIFDADLGLANVDIQLGLMPERDLGSVVSGDMTLKQSVVHYEKGGFDVIAGRSGSGNLASLPMTQLKQICTDLTELAKSYDFTIIDLGAGIEQNIRAMASQAQATLIVTTDEPTSLTDAYTYIKICLGEEPRSDLRAVINMTASKQEGEKTYNTLVKACRQFLKFTPPLVGIVRRDRHVSEAIRYQTGILTRFPNSDAASDVTTIAKSLLDMG